MLNDADIRSGSVRFAKDCVGLDYHDDEHTHIDACCHVAFEGKLFNGEPDRSVTAEGVAAGEIGVLRDGLIGRGVLLDVPHIRSTGHGRRQSDLAPWDAPNATAGLHPTTAPGTTEGVVFPIHVFAIQFEDVVRHCEALGRWESMFVAAPLRIVHGTGPP